MDNVRCIRLSTYIYMYIYRQKQHTKNATVRYRKWLYIWSYEIPRLILNMCGNLLNKSILDKTRDGLFSCYIVVGCLDRYLLTPAAFWYAHSSSKEMLLIKIWNKPQKLFCIHLARSRNIYIERTWTKLEVN